MLKRLLTAVLVLGLFMALTGTAFSTGTVPPEVSGKVTADMRPGVTANPAKVKLPVNFTNQVNKAAVPVPDPSFVAPRPGMNDADTNACYSQDYYLGNTTAYRYDLYDAAGPWIDEDLSTKFDVFAYPTHVAEVSKIWAVVRFASHLGGAGLPVRLRIFTDIAGFPGTEIYSQTFTIPARITGATWFGFTLPSPVTIPGGNYHVSIGNDPSAVVGDSLSIRFGTPNTTGRTRYLYGGTWYTMADLFGADYDLWIATDQCEHYSQCYTNAPWGGNVWLWPTPDAAWTDGSIADGFAARLFAPGPETLKTVRVYHYSLPGYYTGTSTNALDVHVFADDGTGSPTGVPLATVSLPAGVGLFPNTGIGGTGWNILNVDVSSLNLVMYGPYHVGAQMTSTSDLDGQLLFALSREDGSAFHNDQSGGSVNFTAPGQPWKNTGVSTTWMTDMGMEVGVLMRGVLCKDEFSSCQVGRGFEVGFVNRLLYMDNCNLPPTYGSRNGIASRFSGEQVNRVEKVRFQLTDETFDGYPDVPNSVKVSIMSVSGGNPGAVIWSTILNDADLTFLPGWTEVVIPGGVQTFLEFFVTVEPIFTLDGDNEWLYFARERVGDPGVTGQPGGGMWVKLCADNLWYQNNVIAAQDNFICEAEFCSIPPNEWACGAGDDFATNSHDYGRTGHSNVALSDAYCDLNHVWTFTDPNGDLGGVSVGGNAIVTATPIVYDTFVVCSFNSRYNILSLNDGALLGTLTGNVAPYFVNTNGIRCNPTIAMVDIGGTPKPILFYGGGTNNGQFGAVEMAVGFPSLWVVTNANRAAKGYAVTLGNTAYSSFVVATIGGVDMVFFGTGDGKIWAANAATGDRIWGPVTMNGNGFRNLAFDGVNLYSACISTPPTTIDGDVYAFDAATGALKWQLSTAGGLKGNVLQAATNDGEIFPDQLAVYAGEVYTNSAWLVLPNANAPQSGVFYRLNAANGAVLSYGAGDHFYEGGTSLTVGGNLVVDAKRVILVGGNTWTSVPLGGTVISYNRYTGALDWTSAGGPIGNNNVYFGNSFLTCETGAADYLVAADDFGYLSVFDADNGREVFNRRVDHSSLGFVSAWSGVAIGKDGTIVAASRIGKIYALRKGIDQPRLEIVDYTLEYPVPYGSPVSTIVTFPGALTNTGCLPLSGTMTFLDADNGSELGTAKGGSTVVERSASIADQLALNDQAIIKNAQFAVFDGEATEINTSRSLMNRAASAMPAFLNGPATLPFTINPGDSFDIVLDVNGPLINRGSNDFYIEFSSNDPDFFLNDHAQLPQLHVDLTGGCLIDTTALRFGAASANLEWVSNTGRLGTGDWTPHGFNISGNVAHFYQGTYVYGVSKYRLAMNTHDWAGGGGEANAWKSMQGDPNQCNGDCKPALITGVSLGQISATGDSYDGLTGNVICKQYIDSVVNHDLGAGWSWDNWAAPFDDTLTMGFQVQSRVFGIVNAPAAFPELNNVTVEFMKVWHRYNDTMSGWKFGAIIDYDIGNDTAGIDQSISTVWSYRAGPASGATAGWGMIKLPFGGCGSEVFPPVKNVKAMDADQAQFNSDCGGNCYWDSVYTYMSQASPISHTVSAAPQDQEMHATLIEHDFAVDDTLKFAVAQFGFPAGLTNAGSSSNYAGLAKLLNKWVGFGRGDVNNDGALNLADIIYLADNVGGSGPGPIPFAHLGDVDASGATNMADVTYLVNYYFHYGACPVGKFIEY